MKFEDLKYNLMKFEDLKYELGISFGMFLVVFGLFGSLDYQDELAEERHYCKMVKEGNWPAFKDNVNCNCIDSSN